MKMQSKRCLFAAASVLLLGLLMTSCGEKKKIKVHGIQSKVVKVIDGNHIELQNGLKVEILGIKPSQHTKKYLEEQVKNEYVSIQRDSKQPEFIVSYKTKIKAYVKVKGERLCVSGKMLFNKTADLRQSSYKDSLNHFIEYAKAEIPRPEMSTTELVTYMKPATFQIIHENGTGTGFFINEDGLALTNNHVLDGTKNAVICFFGDNGTLDEANTRGINSIPLTNKHEKIDFTVFYVQLRPNEKVRYMPLVSQHVKDGSEVYKLGCPVGKHADFQGGILSNYNEGYFTHSIGTNHGDSGGPIVNKKGEVVGINQSIEFNPVINEQAKGIAYGVDALLIRKILDDNDIEYGR